MKVWYKPQSENPDKHPSMPDEFPWELSYSYMDGMIEVEKSEYDYLVSSIDLTEYNNATYLDSVKKMISDRIKYYQAIAPDLIVELYTENTLAGITAQQSDQMFDDFADVLTRLKEGAFPTALYRISLKQPSGFVTQNLIDTWRNKIQSRII
jgi:hypothetical protein